MPFQVRCACGKNLEVQDEWIGKKVRCANCGEVLTVADPNDTNTDLNVAVSAKPTKQPPISTGYEIEDDELLPRSKRSRKADDDEDHFEDRPRRRRPRDDDDDDRMPTRRRRFSRREDINNTPGNGIGGGILMMVIAVVWFFGALYLGLIFWYPPILFVLGVIAVVRGAMNRE